MPESSGLRRFHQALASGGLAGLARSVSSYILWRIRGRPDPDAGLAVLDEWHARFVELRPAPQSVDSSLGFSFVCRARSDQCGALRDTVQSLVDQSHRRWQLLVATDEEGAVRCALEDLDIDSVEHRVDVVDETRTWSELAMLAVHSYVGFLEPGDALLSNALEWMSSCGSTSDMIYTDEAQRIEGRITDPVFKPAWSPRLLLGANYVGQLLVIHKDSLIGVPLVAGEWSLMEHDLLLRLSERGVTAVHMPLLAIHRATSGSQHANVADGSAVIRRSLERRGWRARPDAVAGGYQVVFDPPKSMPSVKIVMPTRDGLEHLAAAVQGVLEGTTGVSVQLVVVDNGSQLSETRSYLDRLDRDHENVRIIRIDAPFNFSQLCNAGADAGATTDYLCFMNNDVQVMHPSWLQQLVGWMESDSDVVGVGPKLLFPDDSIQHAGVILGFRGIAGHYGLGQPDLPIRGTYHHLAREVSALTAACLLVRTSDFQEIGGFEMALPVDFQDVDLCLRLRAHTGGVLVCDPSFPLRHIQSATRGTTQGPSAQAAAFMMERWGTELGSEDPYYSPHLSLTRYDWSPRPVMEPGDQSFAARLQHR